MSILNPDGSFSPLIRGAFGKTAGALIHAATGRPVRFVGGGIGGTTLAAWASSESPQRAALVAKIKLLDRVDCALIQLGRNDAGARIIKNTETQVDLYKSLVSAIRKETGYPQLPVFIGTSQDVRAGDIVQIQQLGWQRTAELLLVRDDSTVKIGFSTYDLATFDGLHQTEQSQITSGTRFGKRIISYLNNTEPYIGPNIGRVETIDDSSTRFFIQSEQTKDIEIIQATTAFVFYANGKQYQINNVYKESNRSFIVQHEKRNGVNLEYTYAIFSVTEPLQGVRDSLGDKLPLQSYSSTV
ncbi:SGNH/GDSL hydrolase family protein [Sphingomonas sp. Leaf23]|uniref:SGNH/GDSL hydrolase family protein n=1 Tax=Sphingomonas sp. Leaf23 TaxID=1735689 RepID=UPI0019111269|nr:SGNH/GDSL hydrolase family protein [Sphingomonas sp. Leaf23]